MTLVVVETPPGRDAAWAYILGVVLGDWLGLQWRRSPSARKDVRITLEGAPGAVVLPSGFLSLPDGSWLDPVSLPSMPLTALETDSLGGLADGLPLPLPVLFGDARPVQISPTRIRLPLDVFGSAFFMLSRYEEAVSAVRDHHDRFPSAASLAVRANFIDRPLIDEYVELLWRSMSRLWPGLRRRAVSFRMLLSHDVDAPGTYGPGPLWRSARVVAGDMVKRRRISAVLPGLAMAWTSRSRLPEGDPLNTFEWLMDRSEASGVKSAFYFIAGRTSPSHDAIYEIDNPAIRLLMRRVHSRGHEVGLHPSYGSYQAPGVIRAEADRLRRICDQENVRQDLWGGRMHYLRWDPMITARAWDDAGLAYDSTLGFPDRAGFRCGSARPFQMFDLARDRPLKLIQRPLIAMECSVIAARYMNLGYGQEAFDVFSNLKRACRRVAGDFCLLWHNSHLATPEDREMYSAILNA